MKAAMLYGGLWALLAALFLALAGIDLTASGLFYDSAQGFFLADWPRLFSRAGPDCYDGRTRTLSHR